jgi:hypothetical protein
MVTYHYVRFYVSIIIHLEVININVRNFNFPIEFYRSSKFYMWVDNDVPNWYPTLKNFYRPPFSKWPPQYRKNSTLSNIIKIWYVSGHHYLPTYQILMISDNVECLPSIFMPCFGSHFDPKIMNKLNAYCMC